MTKLTRQYMERLEESLTEEQREYAYAEAKKLGYGISGPFWIWEKLFLEAKQKIRNKK